MVKVTKDSIISDIIKLAPGTDEFFFEIGMHCLDCPASRGETIGMACEIHGTDADKLVDDLNKYLATWNI